METEQTRCLWINKAFYFALQINILIFLKHAIPDIAFPLISSLHVDHLIVIIIICFHQIVPLRCILSEKDQKAKRMTKL